MSEDEDKHKLDYSKLGFKAGLEIHQQLDTHKLFCNCPSILRKDEPDFIVQRKLHAVAGETGKVDIAVIHEAEKGKEFVYECYHENVCLVDLDEEPPHEINPEALKIALQISLLLNAKIFPITQVMRKTVIDGSNTSGFQRTAMIAHDGWVDTSYGRARIEGIFLEEDSARLTRKEDKKVIYRLDRLGIPLVEITTDASMKNPEQVREVALHIGDILRSCKVKRGIGTIRQDVNFSIRKGDRVELKGFQDQRAMVQVINNEIRRHLSIIESGKKIAQEVRNVLPNGETEYLRPIPGRARMYPETDLPLLKIKRELIDETKKNLPKLSSELASELEKYGLHEEMIKLILGENKIEEFKELTGILKNPELIAKMITLWRSELASKLKKNMEEIEEVINTDTLEKLLHEIKKSNISEENVKPIFNKLMEGLPLEETLEQAKNSVPDNIEEKIMKIMREKPGLSENAYMGLVMREVKGVNGKEVMEIIKRLLERR